MSPRAILFPRLLLLALPLPLALTLGCERPPSADSLKEWSPADHDRAEEMGRASSGAGQGQGAGQAAGQTQPQAQVKGDGGLSALAEVSWVQNCATCHGPLGKGDGPTGPMMKASDLTREEWQASVTDDEIAAVVKNGKGRMPKFDLPDPVIRGLVGRIRATRGR
jgi:cytochrome c oxidase cbb3-type subunit 3